jgi:hypothetical protein
LTLDITSFLQPFAKRGHKMRKSIGGCGTQKSDHRHRRLLRPCRDWPRDRRAADKRDEFASFHRITSRQATRSGIEVGAIGASD